MKILGISCSPRKKGNTVILLEEMLRGAAENGAEIELFSISGKDIRGCDGCYSCIAKGECHIQDDMQPLYEKLIAADGIVFGSPIHFYGMTAQAKAIMDRSFALNKPGKNLANKVGGVIVVAGSIGIIDALKDYYFFITLKQMLPANFVAAYATGKGDAKRLKKGMDAAFRLGEEIVQLVDKKFEFPNEFPRNFFAFGTHTH
ncbi:MAG: flavodoxin family protein [Candidatus Lokiarchaeota archaeon]|nr:flavodoxin family protein [Candidatus Lokiarchaeota archaeon]